jgi:hypothetical protein
MPPQAWVKEFLHGTGVIYLVHTVHDGGCSLDTGQQMHAHLHHHVFENIQEGFGWRGVSHGHGRLLLLGFEKTLMMRIGTFEELLGDLPAAARGLFARSCSSGCRVSSCAAAAAAVLPTTLAPLSFSNLVHGNFWRNIGRDWSKLLFHRFLFSYHSTTLFDHRQARKGCRHGVEVPVRTGRISRFRLGLRLGLGLGLRNRYGRWPRLATWPGCCFAFAAFLWSARTARWRLFLLWAVQVAGLVAIATPAVVVVGTRREGLDLLPLLWRYNWCKLLEGRREM